MRYVRIDESNVVREIITEYDSKLPGIPLKNRYSADFIEKLIVVDESEQVQQNWIYDPVTQQFDKPVIGANDATQRDE